MSCESQTLPNPGILKDVHILIVDSDFDSRYLYKILFETYGAQVTDIESIADAMTLLDYLVPDILICEIKFFNEDVLPLIQRIKAVALGQDCVIPTLVVSAYCAASFAQNLLAMVEDYLLKPIDIDHFVDEVWNLVHLAKSTKKVNIQDWVVKHRVWAGHCTTVATRLAESLI
jgi:response regulator RpfG family c-di-GMP phosphodiesterase